MSKEVFKIRIAVPLAIVSVLVLSLFLSACGGECPASCDDGLACTRDYCSDATDNKCRHDPIDDCTCGDGKCDEAIGENKCSCEDDCGICTGDLPSEYFIWYCDDDEECTTDMDSAQIFENSFSESKDLSTFELTAVYTYDDPFNIDSSLLSLEFKLDGVDEGIQRPKITKVQVYEEVSVARRQTQKVDVAEVDINRILWSTDSIIYQDIPLQVSMSGEVESEKSLTVDIFYEYIDSRNQVKTGSFQKKLPAIMFVDPSRTPSCPASCDDDNSCTKDECSESTAYFCDHTILPGACCGNYVCDSNENKCSCPADCGKCDEIVGSYMEYACVLDSCVSQLRDVSAVQPKTVIDDRSIGDFRILVKTTFDSPFDYKSSSFNLEYELQNKGETVSNLKFTKIQILESSELLGDVDISKTLPSIGSKFTVQVTPDFVMRDIEEDRSITLKVFYEYDKLSGEETSIIRNSYTQSLGKLTFVYPDQGVDE